MALKTYAELDINITDVNSTTFVPALNGRQGDNNREVFLWLKNGKQGYDLTGKTVTLYVKDAAGVVKTASTMNDQTGLSTGHFSLLIPSAIYQAPGAVQDSYIQIKQDDTVITSIPVAFNVVENTMLVTQTQSETYLDSVQQLADKANAELATMTTDLSTVQNAMDALKITIANLNDQYNSDLFAQKAKDNEFKGTNTFDGATKMNGDTVLSKVDIDYDLFAHQTSNLNNLNVSGTSNLGGDVTVTGTTNLGAVNVSGAMNTTLGLGVAGGLLSKNDLNVNGNSNLNGATNLNGDTITNKLDVNGPFFTHANSIMYGSLDSKKTAQADVYDYGLNGHLVRVGNIVTIRVYGGLIVEHPAFTTLQWSIPAGFRPTVESDLLASVGYSKGVIRVFPDGTAGNIDQAFHTSNNNGGDNVSYGFGSWATTDDFPS